MFCPEIWGCCSGPFARVKLAGPGFTVVSGARVTLGRLGVVTVLVLGTLTGFGEILGVETLGVETLGLETRGVETLEDDILELELLELGGLIAMDIVLLYGNVPTRIYIRQLVSCL